MQYSAKRGIATACRPFVCPSVCNVGRSGPHRLEILETNYTTRAISSTKGEHRENLGRLEVGWENVACWSTKAATSLKRVKIEEKLLWGAYRKSPTLFRMVPSQTPYGFLFPKIGGSQPHPKLQSLLSHERVKYGLQIWPVYIHRVHLNKSPLKILEKREHNRALRSIAR